MNRKDRSDDLYNNLGFDIVLIDDEWRLVADYIEQVEREAIANTIGYIGHNEGWEETKDFYMKELLKGSDNNE